MANFPESGIKLIADTDDYTSAMEEALGLAADFDALSDMTITVTADTSEAASALEDLPLSDETVDFTVDVEQTGDDVTEVTSLQDETINTEINIEETDTAKETLSAVETIKNLKILETVWNIAGTAVDLFQNFAGKVISPMLDLEDAVARVNATTGNAIPNARELISNIFYDDLGESINQVADLITTAEQLKLPIEEATRAALTFTHTWQDENPTEVIKTLNALVSTGLAKNFTEAGDLLAVAFQNGANKGHDLLKAVEDNAVAIQGLGLDGQEAMSLIKTGLDNGFTSADQVLKVLEKIKQNVQNAAGNATSDVSKTLNILGIANPAETGEAWSAEFFKKVIDGIKNAPGLTDTEKEALFTNLVGGKMGGKTFSAFLKMSPEDADNVFANLAGASERAATAIDDSLRGAIDDFMLVANKAAQDFLSSEQIDLPGKINALKTGIQDGLNALSEGGTLGEALTIALKPIGFDDEFAGLEAMLGNFVIAILQVVSSIQSLDPKNWAAKAGTDAQIAKLSAQQLTFDLQVGNADEVTTEIATAVSRGVSPDKITAAVGGAINELIADGSEAALAKAQALIDTLNAPIDMNKVPTLASGAPMNVEPVVTPEALEGFQTKLDASKPVTVKVGPDPDSAFMDSLMPMAETTSGLGENAIVATEAITAQNEATATQATNATKAAPPVKKLADTTKAYGDAATSASQGTSDTAYQLSAISGIAPGAASGLQGVAVALQVILDKANAVGVAAAGLADKGGTTGGGGGTAGGGGGKAKPSPNFTGTDSTGLGVFSVGEQGREILTTNRDLAVLNNMTTETIMRALNGYIPGGSFSKGGGSSFSVVNNNFVPSQAVADTLGYTTAATLRGMAGK